MQDENLVAHDENFILDVIENSFTFISNFADVFKNILIVFQKLFVLILKLLIDVKEEGDRPVKRNWNLIFFSALSECISIKNSFAPFFPGIDRTKNSPVPFLLSFFACPVLFII
jgi:hypothetical protein